MFTFPVLLTLIASHLLHFRFYIEHMRDLQYIHRCVDRTKRERTCYGENEE